MNACLTNNRKMNLLNCQLPERSIDKISSILHTNNLAFRLPSEDEDDYYNCWGYVAFHLGWEKHVRWLSSYEMEMHLSTHTTPITKDEATAGDIVVFRYVGESLSHTALLTHDLEIICHKPGATPLCVDTMERAIGLYGKYVSYVRPIR